jgi:Uma2 family endonuclease
MQCWLDLTVTYVFSRLLTFEDFLVQYGDDPRHELADGELIDMDSNGPHQAVAGKIGRKVNVEIDRLNLPFVVPASCILRPSIDLPTARRPDLVVLDERALSHEPHWQREPVILYGQSVPLVVEVVSTNWENDYARKVEEYALMGIAEYWIADFRGLGGMRYIGDPKQPTFTVNCLRGRMYEQQQYRLEEPIRSPLFPDLTLRLDDIMPRI